MRFSNSIFEPIKIFIRKNVIVSRIIALLILVVILGLCWEAGNLNQVEKNKKEAVIKSALELNEEAKSKFPLLMMTEEDLFTTQPQDINMIDLSTQNNILEINDAGDYLLSGNLIGSININVGEDIVHLYLNNVSITANEGPAINIQSARKIVITLLADTVNVISDNGDYRESEEFPACIYSESDLTINGTGELKVNGYFKDAIYSKDVLKIVDGIYTIKCKRNAFHANDGMHVTGGDIYISTEKNGFKTDKHGSDGKGNIMVSGGTINIVAGEYTFVATKASLYVYDCMVTQKSIIDVCKVAKRKLIQEGCINE